MLDRTRFSTRLNGLEIVVIVALIIVVGFWVASGVRNAKNRAYDARRQNHMSLITTALELFYRDNEYYPAALPDLVTRGYMVSVPGDPIHTESDGSARPYRYQVTEEEKALDYVLFTPLDNRKAKITLEGIATCENPAQKGTGVAATDQGPCYRITSE